ncbi:MAG: hypothetical protein JKY84_04235 [Emcibacteraceae bacterium]|nr:hypothetical protein [Emcibacteraceae bacterium]
MTPSPTTSSVITASQQPVKETVVSGIIIDTSLRTNTHNKSEFKPASQDNSLAAATETAYNQKSNSQITDKNYYLATPTSVLKFQSSTPLVPGTIVSFTVQSNVETSLSEKPSRQTSNTNPAQATTTQPLQTESNIKPDNVVSPVLLDKIDQFLTQPLDLLIEDWGSISLALSALTSASSASMAAILASRIPNMQSPEQITSTMFFFLAALKSSHPARTWLGPDVSAKLKQLGAGKVIDRIDRDFSRIARINSESPIGEWRPVLIPLQNGPDLSAIPMLTKQIIDEEQRRNEKNNKNKDQETKINATRFILEINFSQFGMMLIDGLLKDARLDIILKASKQIPFTVKTKLSHQYTEALKKNNFDGELVVIDNSPTEVSVRKLLETLTNNVKFEQKI